MMPNKIIEELQKYNNVAILGFGKEGISTYNFIRRYDKNMHLTILDAKDISLDDPNVTIKKYNSTLEELLEYDKIIKTPGIPFASFNQDEVKNKLKSKITSQMELLLEFNRENVIGITGTKGKSTTTTMIYDVLKDQLDKVILVGNIGIPVFDEIENFEDAIIVAEMSSHQLEYVDVSPHIGLVLNLFVDHLDHTGSVEFYHEAKMHMFMYQNANDYALFDADNYYLNKQDFSKIKSQLLTVSNEKKASIYLSNNTVYINDEAYVNKNDINTKLKGEHNFKNIMFVLLVSKLFNLDLSKTLESIKKFEPLPHRLEFFGNFAGISFYDDAIATIPEATINACKTLDNVDTLIFGGNDRNIDYSLLIDYLNKSNISHFICMPETGYKIAESLDQSKVIYAETLDDAVNEAFKLTEKGKICLLSPAASSYNSFKNFEEKGDKFKELVKNHR